MACKIRAYLLMAILPCSVLFNLSRVHAQDHDYSYRDHPLLQAGDSLINIEKWDEALKAFLNAENTFSEQEDTPASIYAKGKIAYVYMLVDDFNAAFNILSEALIQGGGEQLPEKEISEICTIYSYLGNYYRTKPEPSPDSSFMAIQKAIEICKGAMPEYPRDLALAYFEMGQYYDSQDGYGAATEYYAKSTMIRSEVLDPNSQELGTTYYELGSAYRDNGDQSRSRDYLEKAIAIFEYNQEYSPSVEYKAYNNLANTYFDDKAFDKALPLYKEAIAMGLLSSNQQTLVRPYNNLASAYAYSGFPDSARMMFQRALNINLNSKRVRFDKLSESYFQMGDANFKAHLYDSSKYYFGKSVQILENMSGIGPILMASSLAFLGRAEAYNGDVSKGLDLVQKAIIELELNFIDYNIYSNPELTSTINNDRLYQYLEFKAEIFYLKYIETDNKEDLAESYRLYLMVDEIADKIRNGPYSDRTKLALSNSFKQTAANALRNIQELNALGSTEWDYMSNAFDFMEKNRYSELYSNISKLKQKSDSQLTDSLYDIEKELIYEISIRRFQLSMGVSDSVRIVGELELFKLENQYEELRLYVAKDLPSYQRIDYDSLLSITEVQNLIDENTLLIEYFLGDSLITIISVGKEESELTAIKLTPVLKNKILQLQGMISNYDLNRNLNEVYDEYSELSYEIYTVLVGNFINNKTQKLIVSPDGLLSQLPFDAFITSSNGTNFRNAEYLMNKLDIQYIFSTNLNFKNPAPAVVKNPSILAFAYSNGEKNEIPGSRNGMNEIPSTAKEVKVIGDIFGAKAKLVMGSQATETAFKDLAIDYDILHLAIHGVGDTVDLDNSRLIFRSSNGDREDGNLYAHELYNIRFKRLRLAVLSACESGIGTELPGEGVFSMARGFAYTGCPTTIMSLWKANDVVTADIMEHFYTYLNQGLSTSQSLRQAKIKYLEESKTSTAHPSYWAAFIHMGDSKPVIKKTNVNNKYLFWALPFLILLFWYNIWRRAKRRDA